MFLNLSIIFSWLSVATSTLYVNISFDGHLLGFGGKNVDPITDKEIELFDLDTDMFRHRVEAKCRRKLGKAGLGPDTQTAEMYRNHEIEPLQSEVSITAAKVIYSARREQVRFYHDTVYASNETHFFFVKEKDLIVVKNSTFYAGPRLSDGSLIVSLKEKRDSDDTVKSFTDKFNRRSYFEEELSSEVDEVSLHNLGSNSFEMADVPSTKFIVRMYMNISVSLIGDVWFPRLDGPGFEIEDVSALKPHYGIKLMEFAMYHDYTKKYSVHGVETYVLRSNLADEIII